MSQKWWLHNQDQLNHFVEHIKHQWIQGKKPTVMFEGESRTQNQNAMLHELIHEIASQKQDESAVDIKRYVKLHLGVPILRASNKAFGEKYDQVIKNNLTYEQKLLSMDLLPVTSSMNREQFTILLDHVIAHYQQQGIEFRPH